jgi:hypothetical protein
VVFPGGVSATMTVDMQDGLFQFFAGTFHQDYVFDGDPDGAISAFISQTRIPATLTRLADDLDAYADAWATDDGLEKALFAELGCYYVPSADGISPRAWLRHVASRLRVAASDAGSD